MDGKRESGNNVLSAWLDDDNFKNEETLEFVILHWERYDLTYSPTIVLLLFFNKDGFGIE